MYKKIADNITKQIIKNKEVDCNNFEVYSYGFELLISYCSYLLLLAIIAGITKSFIDTLMFSMGFIMLRKFSGGYHASTYLKCHIYFILNQLMFIAFVKILPFNIYQYFILSFSLISTLIVFLLAPIDHSNRSFNKKEYSQRTYT